MARRSPWAGLRAAVDAAVASTLTFDESIRVSRIDWHHDAMPPTLYVDDWTVLREVQDPCMLRAGDHCIVGLNILHKLWSWSDSLCSLLTSWEVLPFRFFHHFVVLDDVTLLAEDGRPLRADGAPARIAEFSDTPAGAYRRVTSEGFTPRALLRGVHSVLLSPAQIHLPPLADYVRRRQPGHGIFVVSQQLSEEQRRKTVETALALVHAADAPVYRVFSSNCEHLAWQLDASSAYKGRWVSPQVPHNLWKLFRFCLNLFGVACLRVLADVPQRYSTTHATFAALYHLLATIPVGAQVQACLVRTAVNLTQRRGAGEIEKGTYEYLMIKETLRATWLTLVGVGFLCMMPRLVWESEGRRFWVAAVLSLCAYNLAVIAFNAVHQLMTRALLGAGIGVPVPVFDDLRTGSPRCYAPRAATERHSTWPHAQPPSKPAPAAAPPPRGATPRARPAASASGVSARRRSARSQSPGRRAPK